MSDLPWLTATEIGQAYLSRRLSPVELLEALLARVRRLDPQVNAFISLDEAGAHSQARQAEAEIMAGRYRGPLHGIPIAIKDIIDVRDQKTTCHSRLLLDNVAPEDATVVQRLRQAGAVILGKLSTWEFAIGTPSDDLPFPVARNPWNLDFQPGGSSSGSGAGLAAGFFPLSIGTDTGGSVRHPAAACGVIGLKPTYGLVSRRGVFPLAFSLDHVGPMARSTADIAALLDGISGYDPADPSSVAVVSGGYGAELGLGARGIRIGFVRHWHERDMPAHPEVAAALDNAAAIFRSLGAEVVDVTLPPLQHFSSVARIIMHAEAWSVHRTLLQTRAGDYGLNARRRLMSGAFLSAGDYVDAQRMRRKLIASVNDVLAGCDVLLTPNALDPALPLRQPSGETPTNFRQSRTPFNVTGHPAISLMSGLSRFGLPLSLQLAAGHFREPILLRVAHGFEREASFQRLHPPSILVK